LGVKRLSLLRHCSVHVLGALDLSARHCHRRLLLDDGE
jgi:hypothetical protein